jgi:SAM-dependent methyltransferase/predicted O-methyltransferase YrrM
MPAEPSAAALDEVASSGAVAHGQAHSRTARERTVQDIPPPPATHYGPGFFEALSEGTRRSAAIVTPVLIELFRPESVVDVGCGTGLWLSAFRQRGVTDVLGVDGRWVSGAQLEIPSALFHEHDLSRPLELDRTFDLALCLEVAEHLPPETAGPLVESLTRLAPVVVFSAAIPAQRGEGHVNEQWPSFWSDLFAARGYGCLVDLRYRIWTNPSVEVWYRQNLLCYVAADVRRRLPWAKITASGEVIDVVHPDLYLRLARELEQSQYYGAELERRNRQLQQELAQAQQERAQAQNELESVINSRAWRLWQTVRPILTAIRRANGFPPSLKCAGPNKPMDTVEQLIAQRPHFHAWPNGEPANWAVAPDVLRYISQKLVPGMRTLETGAGQTTVVFAMAGTRHTCITPDRDQAARIRAYCAAHGIEDSVTFVHESSDVALAAGGRIPETLDFVLIDGAHRFPFPILDWHYTERRLGIGGIVAVDDYPMPSVKILYDFLMGEDEWELIQRFERTAFFRRTRETVNTLDWLDQKINETARRTFMKKQGRAFMNRKDRRLLHRLRRWAGSG